MKLVTLAICQEFLFSKRCVKEAAVAALCMLELNPDIWTKKWHTFLSFNCSIASERTKFIVHN